MKKILFLSLTFLFLNSCSQKPLKVFIVNNNDLKLFKDSTYTQGVSLLERTYVFKGTWSGSFEEGAVFKTKIDIESALMLESNPLEYYKVINGNAILFLPTQK